MKNRTAYTTLLTFLVNALVAYLMFALCRIVFVAENWQAVGAGLFGNPLGGLLWGAFRFDTAGIIYTNLLYIVLMLLPCHYKERHLWQTVAWWVFVVVNALSICANLADAAYFPFTGRRTTISVFSEFSNENNMLSIIGAELVRHWYLFAAGMLFIGLLCRLAVRPKGGYRPSHLGRYYLLHSVIFLLFVPLAIGGIRGGFAHSTRPLTMSDANSYVSRPAEAAAIVNTPFSVIRSVGTSDFTDPGYFTPEELEALYSPVHQSADSIGSRRNVVILIVESLGREYIGALNDALDGGTYRGFTPFVDSLINQSMTFDRAFANGRKSIDAMPSILSSIPMFGEPFILTSSAMNDLSGIAGELSKAGYSSAFFHGAENGSMGFQAFAKTTGFDAYYGRTEYDADPRFGGEKDFDGTWAIWDEPFLQFYALKMTEMQQPFVTAVFTASNHHPFAIPDNYRGRYAEEADSNPIHKCVCYTDEALRRFFETAQMQPWFRNTIFVLTNDHTNQPDHALYETSLGVFMSPILFYDPSGELFPAGRQHKVAQQTDIMPTLLAALGTKQPYVAFGKDLFSTPDSLAWAVNYQGGIYQYVQGNQLILFDSQQPLALYDIEQDPLLTNNKIGNVSQDSTEELTRALKARIQSYMQRMIGNQLTVK